MDAELQAARNKLSAMALDLNTSQHEASRLSVDNSRLVQDVKAWAERHEATVGLSPPNAKSKLSSPTDLLLMYAMARSSIFCHC